MKKGEDLIQPRGTTPAPKRKRDNPGLGALGSNSSGLARWRQAPEIPSLGGASKQWQFPDLETKGIHSVESWDVANAAATAKSKKFEEEMQKQQQQYLQQKPKAAPKAALQQQFDSSSSSMVMSSIQAFPDMHLTGGGTMGGSKSGPFSSGASVAVTVSSRGSDAPTVVTASTASSGTSASTMSSYGQASNAGPYSTLGVTHAVDPPNRRNSSSSLGHHQHGMLSSLGGFGGHTTAAESRGYVQPGINALGQPPPPPPPPPPPGYGGHPASVAGYGQNLGGSISSIGQQTTGPYGHHAPGVQSVGGPSFSLTGIPSTLVPAAPPQKAPNPTASPSVVPKANLYTFYGKKPRRKQLTSDDYFNWNNGGRPHELRFTAIFQCPLTGECFPSGRYGDEKFYNVLKVTNQHGQEVEVVWYTKKIYAEHGAAARCYDCLSYREALLQGEGAVRMLTPMGTDPPYTRAQAPAMPPVPALVAEKITDNQKRIQALLGAGALP